MEENKSVTELELETPQVEENDTDKPLDKNAHVCIFDKPHEKILDINWYGHKIKIDINYCPKCGRDLRGKEKDV